MTRNHDLRATVTWSTPRPRPEGGPRRRHLHQLRHPVPQHGQHEGRYASVPEEVGVKVKENCGGWAAAAVLVDPATRALQLKH